MSLSAWASTNVQVDIGNLMVGVATILIAFSSLFISLRTIRSQNNQKISEQRVEWIENVREKVSEFIETLYAISNEVISASADNRPPKNLDGLNSNLMRLEAYIQLCFNPRETEHENTLLILARLRGLAAMISISRPETQRMNQLDAEVKTLVDSVKTILKTEWDRSKRELN